MSIPTATRVRSRRPRTGASLLEYMLALVVGAAFVAGAVYAASGLFDQMKVTRSAEQLKVVQSAATRYVETYYEQLRKATASGMVYILPDGPTAGAPDLPSLMDSGFLPAERTDRNSFGQGHVLAVRAVGAQGRLEALLFTVGGQDIPDSDLGRISKEVGSQGGFVASAPIPGAADTVLGTGGGWRTPVGTWRTGTIGPSAGRLAASMAITDGKLVTDYLYRRDIGVPEANTMRTTLFMGGSDAYPDGTKTTSGNDILNAGSVKGSGNLVAGRDTTAGKDVAIKDKLDVQAGSIAVGRNMKTYRDVDLRSDANVLGRTSISGTAQVDGSGTVRGPDGVTAPRFVDRKDGSRMVDPSGRSSLFNLKTERLSVNAIAYESGGVDDLTNETAFPKAIGDYLKHDVLVEQSIGPRAIGTSSAVAYCPQDYARIMCSTARESRLEDTCAEQDCGIVGSMPVVEKIGDPKARQGCQAVITGNFATHAVATAYCVSNVVGGTQISGVDAGRPNGSTGSDDEGAPQGECPVWAPGTYPNCILKVGGPVCPPWAPANSTGKCVINRCPVWAPGPVPAPGQPLKCEFDFYQPAEGCRLPSGYTMDHGESIYLFKDASVGVGQSCTGETRTCHNGALSGSYTNYNCTAQQTKSCILPWNGQTIAHGASVRAYAAPVFPHSTAPNTYACVPQTRVCNDGVLSGTYNSPTCTVQF